MVHHAHDNFDEAEEEFQAPKKLGRLNQRTAQLCGIRLLPSKACTVR
jgi:hypothetical protein